MTRWDNIHNVVVVGLGITGLSVVKHLMGLDRDLNIKVIDTRPTPPGVDQLDPSIDCYYGDWHMAWLLDADLVVTNPGIPLASEQIQAVLAQGTPVVGDIELFAWSVDAPVIAITGSNGKSTVTDLVGVLARASGLKVGVGGNIGVPALTLLEDPAQLYVLELSSFQLETTHSLALQAAAFLNLSEDHMDRYTGMASYRHAKLRIFEQAQHIVVNRDDRATFPDRPHPSIMSFGSDSEQFGLLVEHGVQWLAYQGVGIIESAKLQLVGQHNIANVLTVFALLKCVDIDYTQLLQPLCAYQGLTHRCQVVVNRDGIRWVNDSKATNVASTLAALSGLTINGMLHLLVGGVGKGADFSELSPALSQLNVTLHCYGRDGDEFLTLHPSAQRYTDMTEVIQSIRPQLQPGDMVMLSPACASFDQFKNFMARGDEFTQLAETYA